LGLLKLPKTVLMMEAQLCHINRIAIFEKKHRASPRCFFA
jgi:hypothetical protein